MPAALEKLQSPLSSLKKVAFSHRNSENKTSGDFAQRMSKVIDEVSTETMDALMRYELPGNIRELQNVIERAVILHEKGNLVVKSTWLSRECPNAGSARRSIFKRSAMTEREIIGAALAETKGRVSGPWGAALRLGMPPSTLESKIRSMNIDKYTFKTAGAMQSS